VLFGCVRCGWARLGEGKGEAEYGAAAGVVGGGDGAAVAFDDAVADGQSEAGSGVGGVGVGAVEAFEDGGVLAVGDADAAVGDLDRGPAVTVRVGGWAVTVMRTGWPGGVYLMALPSRLSMTWRSSTGSPWTVGRGPT
jgi:hypothetical protein